MRRSEFKTLLTIGIIGAIVAASIYGGYIDFTPSTVSAGDDKELDTTTTVTIENPYNLPDGMSIDSASYIIFKNGTLTCAKNGETGYTEFYGTDSVDVIQRAIDSTSDAGGGIIFIKSGKYTISSSIWLYSNITLFGELGTILYQSDVDNIMFQTVQELLTTAIAITSNIAEGSTSLAVADGSKFSAGSFIKILTTDTISNVGGTLQYNRSEIAQISTIAGNTLTLTRGVDEAYTTGITWVYGLDCYENIVLKHLSLVGPGMNTTSAATDLWNIIGLEVSDCYISQWGRAAIQFNDCRSVLITSSIFEFNYLTGYGYSIAVIDACSAVKISDNIFRGYGRHFIVTGSNQANSLCPGGSFRDLCIQGNTFESSSSDAINNHAPSYGSMTISGNSFKHCISGILLYNSYSMVSENYFEDCVTGIVKYKETEERVTVISNNIFNNIQGSYGTGTKTAISIRGNNTNIIGNSFEKAVIDIIAPVSNIMVTENVIHNSSTNFIISYTTSGSISSLTISNNAFTNASTAGRMCSLSKVNGLMITNNHITDSGMIYLSYCNRVSIGGNNIINSSCGIEFHYSTNMTIIGNSFYEDSANHYAIKFLDPLDADTPGLVTSNTILYHYNVSVGSYTNIMISNNLGYP